MRKVIFLMLVLSASLSVLSQQNYLPGFVVTLDSDTLYGELNFRSAVWNASNCQFRKTPGHAYTMYRAGEIKSYLINDKGYYISKNLGSDSAPQWVFLEYLLNGENVDLYYYQDKDYTNIYLLQKDTMLLELLNTTDTVYRKIADTDAEVENLKEMKEYLGLLKYAFSDQWSVINKIDQTTFEHKSLIKITKEYHSLACPGAECITYTRGNEKVKLSFSVRTGVLLSQLALNNPDLNGTIPTLKFDRSLSPELGVGCQLAFPYSSRAFMIRIDAMYTQYSFEVIRDYETASYYREYYEHAKLLAISPGMRYNIFQLPKTDIYLSGQIWIGSFFDKESLSRMIVPDSPTARDKFNEGLSRLDMMIGYSGGLGIEQRLTRSAGLIVEAGYQHQRVFHGIFFTGDISQLRLVGGIIF